MVQSAPHPPGIGHRIGAIIVASLVATAVTGALFGLAMAAGQSPGALSARLAEWLPQTLAVMALTGFWGMILGTVTAALVLAAVAIVLERLAPRPVGGTAIGLAAAIAYLALGLGVLGLAETGVLDDEALPVGGFLIKLVVLGFFPCTLLLAPPSLVAVAVFVPGTLLAGVLAGRVYVAICRRPRGPVPPPSWGSEPVR